MTPDTKKLRESLEDGDVWTINNDGNYRYTVQDSEGNVIMDNEQYYPSAPMIETARGIVEAHNALPALLDRIEFLSKVAEQACLVGGLTGGTVYVTSTRLVELPVAEVPDLAQFLKERGA